MAINFTSIWNGLKIKAKAVLTSDTVGEIETSSVDNKTYLHNGTIRSPILTEDSAAVIENKDLVDSTTNIVDNTDPTIRINFDAAGTTSTRTTVEAVQTVDRTITLPDATDTLVGKATTDTLTNKSLSDATTSIVDSVDPTIQVKIDAAGSTATSTTITSSQTVDQVITLPDATDTLIGKATTDTLTNKTIDANGTGNSISNLEVADLAAGVLNTSVTMTGASDTQVPSALAIKTYVDNSTGSTQTDVDDLITLSGVPANSVDLGTFTGTTIADDQTIKGALQDLETGLESHITDTTDAHDASAISVSPTVTLLATDVQSALVELESETTTVSTAISDHINDTVDAHDASAISSIPFGNLAATEVQAALNELQTDIDTRATSTDLSNHISDTTTHGTTGDIVGTSDTQTLTNKSIDNLVRLEAGRHDTYANLVTYAATATDGQFAYATDTKEVYKIINNTLSLIGGGGGSGELLPSALFQQSFETAVIGDFTQTGLSLLTTPSNILIKGTTVAQLIHQPATSQSFKQTIAVDQVFRGKIMKLSLDARTTASSGNVTITLRDETNSVDISSSAITTGSQAISVTTTSGLATLAALSNSVVNTLSVGMSVTGSGIPASTTILSINTTTGVVTLTANATASATVSARFSGLPESRSVSFLVPKTCASLSYTITALQEANSPETYIDDVYCQLGEAAKTSTSITVPKNNDTEWQSYVPTTPNSSFATTPTGITVASNDFQWRREGADLLIRGKFTTGTPQGTEARLSLPTGLTTASTSIIATIQVAGTLSRGNATLNTQKDFRVLIEPNTQYITFSAIEYVPAASPLVKIAANNMVSVTETCSINARIPINGWLANETETKQIDLTSSVLVTQPDTNLEVQGANGFGSVSTLTRRFSNIIKNIGSSVSYVDSPTLGASLTILEDGIYTVVYVDSTAASSSNQYIRINGVIRGSTTQASASGRCTSTFTGHLSISDAITFTTDTASTGVAPAETRFEISKVGSTKIINPSSDQKVEIPTHALRFEGASSRGSTDTAIVKFDTLANIRGDGFEVVNTVANGTVVTIKKAGTLNIGTTLYYGSAAIFTITKNLTSLTTAIPTVASEILAGDGIQGTSEYGGASYSGQVNVGDKIRITSNVSPLAQAANSLNLSLQENSVQVALSNVAPRWEDSDSSVEVRTANGYGSTNTKIRRFSNVNNNLGSAITYTDSATLGGSFTINESGLYDISYTDLFTTSGFFGITKNDTQPTANIQSITNASEVLSVGTTPTANYPQAVSTQVYLQKNDIIRAHTEGATTGSSGTNESKFSISKVGKTQGTVDVTPFVNIKTQDTQAIEALTATSTFGSTNTGVPVLNITKNTANGIIRVDSSATTGTSFVALKACAIQIDVSLTSNVALGNASSFITIDSTVLNLALPNGIVAQNSNVGTNIYYSMSANVSLAAGQVLRIQRDVAGINLINKVTLTATASSDSIATPTQQISSDTLPFAFKATAIVDADPIGTFNTYTYAANTNTATISASAPTQTVASMNADGIMVTARAYNAASTTALPTRFDIKIGTGEKDYKLLAYRTAGRVNEVAFEYFVVNTTVIIGTDHTYNEKTGILSINGGTNILATNTSRGVVKDATTAATYGTGYFVFNASTTPSIAALPILQPRIATLSDVKASGTQGGSAGTTTTHTRVLNTLVDPTGIVTSLVANQFTLPRGVYYIEASAPVHKVNQHKIRIRNITDTTTTLIGTSELAGAASSVENRSFVYGEFTITTAKTFELQHYTSTAVVTDGLGVATSSGESETFAVCKITKVRDI